MTQYEHRRPLQLGLKVIAASSALLALLGAGCPTTSLPPATGDIEITILRGVDTAGSLCPITRINWQLDPVAVPSPRADGSTVGTTALNKWSSLSGGTGSTNSGTAQFPVVCKHTETFSGLAPGTWAVTGKAQRGNAPTCNKIVSAGSTTPATWVFNVGGTAESCN